ncbi:MAG: hypothetical protein HYY18_08705 [Planctomycetes bacterium]|nr:hypothetical protein [Planctomycetota bacterium]
MKPAGAWIHQCRAAPRLHINRNRREMAVEGGAKLLVADLPQNRGKRVDYYSWYHGTQALFQWDAPAGKYWKGWNEAMKKAVLSSQRSEDGGCAEGSWDVDVDRWAFEGGRVYATAINVLTLETYYRYPTMKGRK